MPGIAFLVEVKKQVSGVSYPYIQTTELTVDPKSRKTESLQFSQPPSSDTRSGGVGGVIRFSFHRILSVHLVKVIRFSGFTVNPGQ
jgi:hypothetical protein